MNSTLLLPPPRGPAGRPPPKETLFQILFGKHQLAKFARKVPPATSSPNEWLVSGVPLPLLYVCHVWMSESVGTACKRPAMILTSKTRSAKPTKPGSNFPAYYWAKNTKMIFFFFNKNFWREQTWYLLLPEVSDWTRLFSERILVMCHGWRWLTEADTNQLRLIIPSTG